LKIFVAFLRKDSPCYIKLSLSTKFLRMLSHPWENVWCGLRLKLSVAIWWGGKLILHTKVALRSQSDHTAMLLWLGTPQHSTCSGHHCYWDTALVSPYNTFLREDTWNQGMRKPACTGRVSGYSREGMASLDRNLWGGLNLDLWVFFFFFPARENSMVELGPDLTYKWTQGCWQEFCDLPCVDLVNARAVSAKYAGDPRLPASLQDWVITHGNLCCPSNVRTIDLASPSWGNTFRSASDFASGLIL
jgi:hypothetical protein